MRMFSKSVCAGALLAALVACSGDGAGDDAASSLPGSGGASGTRAATGGAGGATFASSGGSGGGPFKGGAGTGGVRGEADASTPVHDAGQADAGKADGSTRDAGDAATTPYNPCPAKGTPCAIMALGDSITDGAGGSGGSYRPALFHLALALSQTITFVGRGMNGPDMVDGVAFPKGHEGYSGYTIDDGGGRTGIHDLTDDAINMFHPHIITLMIGTNDVGIQLDLENAPTRLGGLMDTILDTDRDLLLVVAQIVPTTDDAQNTRVKAYNDAMPALVKARADAGKHIVLVDMYGAFTANPNYKTEYMNDQLHPKDAGYTKMADVWYAAIGPLLR